MDASIFTGVQIVNADAPLPNWLDPKTQNIRLLSADDIDQWSADSRRKWCHLNARYGIVTSELIEWLKTFCDGRKTIEVGSGHGDLAYHMRIVGTDSYAQLRPWVANYYAATGQPQVRYPKWVKKMDAVKAVRSLKPQVVIGSWVTHKREQGMEHGSATGLREELILKTGVDYVVIGNLDVHHYKPIMALPHEEYHFPWLRSRASRPENDRIFVWRGSEL